MADIELVIKLPEEIYLNYKKVWQKRRGSIPESCIAFGVPLPKGHGDLIDRDEFHQTLENINIKDNDKWFNWLQKACIRLAESPTIIEADKAESEG